MAAVLCQSVGSLCSSFGTCITLPFRACGNVCGSACEKFVRVFASPFTPYIVTTIALNLPPVVWGIRSAVSQLLHSKFDCRGETWLWVYAVLSFIHMVASFYISSRIQDSSHDFDDDIDDGVKVEMPVATTGMASSSVNKTGSSTSPPPPATEAPYHAYNESMDEAEKGGDNSNKNMNSTTTEGMSRKQSAVQAASSFVRMATAAAFPASANKTAQVARSGAFATSDDGSPGKSNSIQRLKQVLCYDIGVAIYILVIVFWFCWQSYGISQVLFARHDKNQNNEYDDDSAICEQVETWVVLSIMCGFLYIMLVCVAFACSFLCLRY